MREPLDDGRDWTLDYIERELDYDRKMSMSDIRDMRSRLDELERWTTSLGETGVRDSSQNACRTLGELVARASRMAAMLEARAVYLAMREAKEEEVQRDGAS